MRPYIKATIFLTALLFAATGLAEETPEAKPDTAENSDADAPEAAEEKPEENDSEKQTESAAEQNASLDVWAEQVIYEGDTFTCTGNVIITRGKARIECDEVEGVIVEAERTDSETGEKKTERTIKGLVATGSPIVMTTDAQKATCLRAEYDVNTATITLTGSEEQRPTLVDGERHMTGDPITYDIEKNKWVIKQPRIRIPIEDDKLPDILK